MMNKSKRKIHTVHCMTALMLTVSVISVFIFTACKTDVSYEEIPSPDITASAPSAEISTQDCETAPPSAAASFIPTPLPEFSVPVLNFEGHFVSNGCTVICPCFTGANTAELNDALLNAFERFSYRFDEPCNINYELAFCESGLVSVWMIAYPADSAQDGDAPAEILRTAFNYDIYAGKALKFSDCFGCEYTPAYAEKISLMLTEAAEADSTELLGSIKPVPADQIFIFSGSGIIFYYRLYEIAAFEEGTPMLTLSYNSLASLFASPESPIGRLLNKD